MANPEHIRKQVYDLNIDDLNNYPLWQFCLDEEGEEAQDECTVKPSEDPAAQDYSDGFYILACDVSFSDGTSEIGYIYSGQADDLGCLQPIVISASGQVGFWLGSLRFIKNPEEKIAAALAQLQKDSASVFPVRFRARPHLDGTAMEVVVPGFLAQAADQKLTNKSFVVLPSLS